LAAFDNQHTRMASKSTYPLTLLLTKGNEIHWKIALNVLERFCDGKQAQDDRMHDITSPGIDFADA
jgi:hypothetical protein